ncbi:hypothetical protein ACFYOD_34790 [Streptomyces sp. NPDC006703]|uniref:hypothetical protein n=1 Tax=Streptomyces sp. NPDC006703 TaxID=3364759 RepID=UPI003685D28D
MPPGKARIGYRLKYEDPGLDPYYVSVAVKPPHEFDAQGRPTVRGDNRQHVTAVKDYKSIVCDGFMAG